MAAPFPRGCSHLEHIRLPLTSLQAPHASVRVESQTDFYALSMISMVGAREHRP